MKLVRKPGGVSQKHMITIANRRKEYATTKKVKARSGKFPMRNFRPAGVNNCDEACEVDNDGDSEEN